MNMAIAFFVGCVTFVLMMGIKIPIKKFIFWLSNRMQLEQEEQYVFCRRCNVSIIFITMLVAMLLNYFVLRIFDLQYFKMCYTLKAGAIAVALYAVYEQWFGEA